MNAAYETNVTVITGATGGMGSATARLMAASGAPLVLCDIDKGRLEALAASLRPQASVEILADDIADPAFPSRLADMLGQRLIGALIHTAGLSPTMADGARILSVNYDASARLAAMILPRMAPGACAVLISSSSAYECQSPEIEAALKAIVPAEDASSLLPMLHDNPGFAYMVSKRGVQLLVQQQAWAFGQRGARIMSISPGLIDTSMGRQEQKAHPMMDAMLAKTPLGRYGDADEIASVAAFLCSPGASFVSGSDIKVDGGVLAEMHW